MKTIASLFSGGGGVEVGSFAADFEPIWGIEIDPTIASVYAEERRSSTADQIG